jgi:hypothetical protein
MRNTSSVILTSRSIDVRVIVILLCSRALHHLIVLIHLVLVSRIASAHLLRIWRLPTRMLVAHLGLTRHPNRSILRLLARVSSSPPRVARLLRKPAAACGHQHTPVSLWRVQSSTTIIPVLRLEHKLFAHILEQASLLPLFSESLCCLNLILLFLGILISALTCP